MISVVQGRPGMGKSVYLVYRIIGFLKMGKKVYSNIDVKLPSKFKNKDLFQFIPSENLLITLPDLREGEVVVDEIQVFLNSRKWDTLPEETQVFLQQHRKRGLNILGAMQSVKRSDKVFRELIQRFFDIRKVFVVKVFGDIYGFFWLREFDPDTIESQSGNFERIGGLLPDIQFFGTKTFHFYSTTQELNMKRLCKKCKDSQRKKVQCVSCGVCY